MFAVVAIPNFSLQAVLRIEPELRTRAVALVDPALPKPGIVQTTPLARSFGVIEGQTASQAMARCGELIIKSRSPAREQGATDVLLQTAYAFSPNIESTAPGVCTLELKGLGIRFENGDAERWAEKLLQVLAQFHLEAQVGFARTPELALVAARAARPVLKLEHGHPFRSAPPETVAQSFAERALPAKPLKESNAPEPNPASFPLNPAAGARTSVRFNAAGQTDTEAASMPRSEGTFEAEMYLPGFEEPKALRKTPTLNSIPTPNSQLPTPNSQLPTSNSQLPTPNSELRTSNSQLPLAALEPPPEILEILNRWGIRTIGELLALGKDRVVERLGPVMAELFDRVSAESARPLKLVMPPDDFAEQAEFEKEIETIEPLLFILRRFVEQLSRRVELIYLVIAEFHLRLDLVSGAAYEHTFKIPSPTGNIETLFRMLHTHLENVRTGSPIVSLRLSAKPARPEVAQFGLFETALRDPNRFAETLARLTALCDSDRVGTPKLEATHRPDAFRMTVPQFEMPSAMAAGASRLNLPSKAVTADSPRLPQPPIGLTLRRFRPPISAHIEFREQRPAQLRSTVFSGAIAGARGPFLSSGNWWDANRWTREEWDVQTADGALYRIFHSPEGSFVEGVYD